MSTVLIVDDEVGFLDELMLALSRDKHIVMSATNATRDGDSVSNIKAFIAGDDDFLLTSKTWIRVSPDADDSASWFIRSTEWSDVQSRLCVIPDYEDRCYQGASLTHLLARCNSLTSLKVGERL